MIAYLSIGSSYFLLGIQVFLQTSAEARLKKRE
jgi:hypothetical protein